MEPTKLVKKFIKGVWIWQKEWWWAIAVKELISRKLEDNPSDSVTLTVSEVNAMLDEVAGSFSKRLKALATSPLRISIRRPTEIIIENK